MDQSVTPLGSANCVSCQQVTTNDGRTVWVCENCQTVNQPSLDQLVVTPSAVQPSPAPVVDASSAQAELNAAAQAAATTPIPETPTPAASTSETPTSTS